ncbi:hypothetical protein AAFF_G00015880 [Aldrovandia affinis]|uniref:C-type lectin domain-containing protein n=1 Tax=Aldrovandia affinis TaxID=143900 RepID=A0AAD7VXX2_9TELE|nr:hypothetical protein AAFF_G00015880 [Aldrovandia affinis]
MCTAQWARPHTTAQELSTQRQVDKAHIPTDWLEDTSASQNCSMGCVEEPLRVNNSTLDKDQLQRDFDAVVVKFPVLDQYCPLRSQKRVCRPCPEGWEQRNSECYYFSTEDKNWNDSRSACLKQGADLVIIETEEEQDFIYKHTGEDVYWIGLSDSETEGTWLWVDGTPLQKDKTFWVTGEPDDYGGSEDCAAALRWRLGDGWVDFPCHRDWRSVCETDALPL